MSNFNIIGIAVGNIISANVAELANAIVDGIITPTIDPLLQRIGGGGNRKIVVKFGELTIDLTDLINSLIKFFVFAIIIFVLFQLGVQIARPITWVKVTNWPAGA